MNEIFLDDKPVTIEELNEARNNPNVRIVEDKNNPGHYKSLQHFVD